MPAKLQVPHNFWILYASMNSLGSASGPIKLFSKVNAWVQEGCFWKPWLALNCAHLNSWGAKLEGAWFMNYQNTCPGSLM
jgi:hypothetical protein